MISAVILTKNQEKNIRECIGTLGWCSEIIVIDDDSHDKTVHITEQMGAKVYRHPLDHDFAQQRNFALEKAKEDWVLFIDADERVSPSLQFEIVNHINSTLSPNVGFFIPRRDILWGKELRYGEVGNTNLLRLAKKNAGLWHGKVHEEWKVKGSVGLLKNHILHYPHQSIHLFLDEINYYTTLRAQELFDKKKKTNTFFIIAYPVGKFLFNYVIRLGILDGIAGLIVALMMSFHSFLVRGKLWLLWQKQ